MGGRQPRGQSLQHALEHGDEGTERVDLPVELLRLFPERRRRPRRPRRGVVHPARQVVGRKPCCSQTGGQPSAGQGRQLSQRGHTPAPERVRDVGRPVERRHGHRGQGLGLASSNDDPEAGARGDACRRARAGNTDTRGQADGSRGAAEALGDRGVAADEASEARGIDVNEPGGDVLQSGRDAVARIQQRAARRLRARR